MWDCIKCGCLAIAGVLGFCPQCFTPKEDNVPKATSGGGSNASAEPGESGYIDPEAGKAAAAKVLTDAGFDPKDVAKVTGTGEPEKAEKPEPEKVAEPPVEAKPPVPTVDLRKPPATGSAPAAASSAPPADTTGQKGA